MRYPEFITLGDGTEPALIRTPDEEYEIDEQYTRRFKMGYEVSLMRIVFTIVEKTKEGYLVHCEDIIR